MDINGDGTFTKKQLGRLGSAEYRGTVSFAASNIIEFHIQEITITDYVIGSMPDLPNSPLVGPEAATKTKSADESYRCEYRIDDNGILVIEDIENVPLAQGQEIRFESYQRE